MMNENKTKIILDNKSFNQTVVRISHQIIEKNVHNRELSVVGINKRGVPLSKMITESIRIFSDIKVTQGSLTIDESCNQLDLDKGVENRHIVLVDTLISSGKTVLSAVNAILSIGNPKSIQFATLVDRGRRIYPINADFVGKDLPTAKAEKIKINMVELGEKQNEVVLIKR